MKRDRLLDYLSRHECTRLWEGVRVDMYVNRAKARSSTVPRGSEINTFLARRICTELGVPLELGD
jgi:hypothetical protein